MSSEDGAGSELEFRHRLRELRRWGRWGDDDQRGALNLLTPAKVLEAVSLVREGRVISLTMDFAVDPAPHNPNPAQLYLRKRVRGQHGEGSVIDFLGVACHGKATTHIDALCHVWNADGMWNGRDPAVEVDYEGVRWAGVEHLSDGIITRGVLVDVAAGRPDGYVGLDRQVTADELRDRVRSDGLDIRSGDALVIHCGREAYDRVHEAPWGSPLPDGSHTLPGLHHSCLEFFYECDPSLIIWDMMDAHPNDYAVPHTTHAAIFSQGIPLLDNARLESLRDELRTLGRHDFCVCVAPLRVVGGTGSPVNPLIVL